LKLRLNFTPEYVPAKGIYIFKAFVKFDNYLLPKLIKFSSALPAPVTNWLWKVHIPDLLLDVIADKQAEIEIIPIKGTLDEVKRSTLKGTGVVGGLP
jgi:hypothetical protein